LRSRREPGRPDASSAPAAIAAIRRAVADVIAGEAAAVVTNPVAKNVLYRSGFAEPGHTEFLGTGSPPRRPASRRKPVMMLWSPELAVVPVTIHLPLAEVPGRLDGELIVSTGRIVDRDLRERFGIARPRLAVAGLNPHAGEDGALGQEDIAIVKPAVDRLIAEGIAARGPIPADTMFHAEARASYDAALAMYHDQALIPIKTLAFDHAVNVTLGLPFVRTSPDHGTRLRHRGQRPRRPVLVDRGDPARGAAGGGRPGVGCGAHHGGRKGAVSPIDELPPLREVIRRHELAALDAVQARVGVQRFDLEQPGQVQAKQDDHYSRDLWPAETCSVPATAPLRWRSHPA